VDVQRLSEHQLEALALLRTGSILKGTVGSGKSRTAIAYFLQAECGWTMEPFATVKNPETKKQLLIITMAKKRDEHDWDYELAQFGIPADIYGLSVIVDSWNNIKKYESFTGFAIFDEQKVSGYGAWVKSFLKITKQCSGWILLSATPGDTWLDYIPVFIANGFYKNKTAFVAEHVIFDRYSKYPKVDKYLRENKLLYLRDHITVNMDFQRSIEKHEIELWCDYDRKAYDFIKKERKDPYERISRSEETDGFIYKPIKNNSKFCFLLRRAAYDHESRIGDLRDVVDKHGKVIVFYNFRRELEIIRSAFENGHITIAEYNGRRHDSIPTTNKWIYLVQYNLSEGWNCITSDCVVFFSSNYSWRTLEQCKGRIDRMNTPFSDLYYYHIWSDAPIEKAIKAANKRKEIFNERQFTGDHFANE
jgi:hypothetical protein